MVASFASVASLCCTVTAEVGLDTGHSWGGTWRNQSFVINNFRMFPILAPPVSAGHAGRTLQHHDGEL